MIPQPTIRFCVGDNGVPCKAVGIAHLRYSPMTFSVFGSHNNALSFR